MRVYDTTGWSLVQVAPYFAQVIDLFDKLHRKMPADVTVESLYGEWVRGDKKLWLVVDDAENVVAFAMTKMQVVQATGLRIGTLMDLAGENVETWAAPLCDALEGWAREGGAHLAAVEGRPGWERILRRFGYKPFAVLMRKEL
jgi:hypothetical protein